MKRPDREWPPPHPAKKYMLVPAWEEYEYGYRFVDADTLARRYGVSKKDCFIYDPHQDREEDSRLIWLRVRKDGNYKLEEQ